AVPGAKDVSGASDLVALWRTTEGQRFQNYQATFTLLDTPRIPRAWIVELAEGEPLAAHCPDAFRRWVERGTYSPLEAPRTIQFRSPAEQQPEPGDVALVDTVYAHFKPDPYAFEACAMELWKMLAQESVTQLTATRRTVDGGRDAVGLYSLGPRGD